MWIETLSLAARQKGLRAVETPSGPRAALFWVIALVVVGSVPRVGTAQDASPAAQKLLLPPQLTTNAKFASSNACRECHPAEHESWHRSFHRTMTQAASPENFVGKFDGTIVDSHGLKYRVFKRDGEFRAAMPDPDEMLDRQRKHLLASRRGAATKPLSWEGLPTVDREVVMSTGSHHYQTYWVESARYPGTLMTLPLVYLINDQRWIPREAAFMYPPSEQRLVTVWNDHCIKCHSTGSAPRPFQEVDALTRRVKETGFRSEVGELGIACEACHGPAVEHVRLHREGGGLGLLRQDGERGDVQDPIVHPAKVMDHRRSSQICGQCHGVFMPRGEKGLRYRDEGVAFKPGDDLYETRYYIFPPQGDDAYADERERAAAIEEFAENREFFRQRYWDNGDVLAGGREFNGLAMSACYTRGTISCLSCHSLHESDPNDQLKLGMEGNQACTQCHNEQQYTTAIAEHTHHAPASSGSECMNCHMPRTAYALFHAIRNHRIRSPDLAGSAEHGVPNACNLCHLDKTLAWTQQHLGAWYGYAPDELSTEEKNIAAALVWMLQGDAAQRVIVAWHVGWKPAQEASGADWLAPFVARLLADPYGVVRYVAEHSLATLPGFEGYRYDFLAPQEELDRAARAVGDRWRKEGQAAPSRTGREVLIDRDGKVAEPIVEWLLERRDNRPVTIQE